MLYYRRPCACASAIRPLEYRSSNMIHRCAKSFCNRVSFVGASVRRIYNVHTHTLSTYYFMNLTTTAYDYKHCTSSDAALFVLLCYPYIVFEQTNDHRTQSSVLNVVKSERITHDYVTMRARRRISRRQIPTRECGTLH